MSVLKKISYTALLGGAGVLFSACNLFSPKEKPAEAPNSPQTQQEAMQETEKLAMAIKNGEALRCVFSNDDGTQVEYQVKGEKMKMAGMGVVEQEKNGYLIKDGEYLYFWQEGATQGMKNKLPSQEEIEETSKKMENFSYDTPDFSSEESIRSYEEGTGTTVHCNPQSIDDNEFVPPSDIEFIDLSAQMQETFSKMDEQMKMIKLPDGAEFPPVEPAE